MSDIPGVTTRRTRTGVLVGRIHYSADPERDAEWVKRERAKYSSQAAWDREQEIVHTAGGGRDVLNKWGHKIIISEEGFCVSPFWDPLGGFDHKAVVQVRREAFTRVDGITARVAAYAYAMGIRKGRDVH